jgi:hypothetical protein
MRWLIAAVSLTFVLSFVAATPASAGTTAVPASMSFIEVLAGPQQVGCPDIAIAFNCGTGVVVPFGLANEEIAFGEGCGGACDFREVTVSGGTLFLNETASNFSCPGACESQGSQTASPPIPLGPPFRATLTDVVIGGTGIFEGASGTLTGSVSAQGPAALIKLSGTITLDP